jgi:hypothetical protein
VLGHASAGRVSRIVLAVCLTVIVVLPAAALSHTSSAAAARANRCGALSAGLHSITSHNVPCATARRFVARYERCHGSACTRFDGYRCSYRSILPEGSDQFQCVRGARVIRWQVG